MARRNTSSEVVTPEAGQVVPESEVADLESRMTPVAFAEAQEANIVASLFKDDVAELARDIRAASNTQNLSQLMLTDPHLPREQVEMYTRSASEAALALTSKQVEMQGASLMMEQELQDVLALIPEDQRAQYVAGFLRHYDLVRTENGGTVTYTQNLDQEQPHSGLYVPTALINNEPQR